MTSRAQDIKLETLFIIQQQTTRTYTEFPKDFLMLNSVFKILKLKRQLLFNILNSRENIPQIVRTQKFNFQTEPYEKKHDRKN